MDYMKNWDSSTKIPKLCIPQHPQIFQRDFESFNIH